MMEQTAPPFCKWCGDVLVEDSSPLAVEVIEILNEREWLQLRRSQGW
jgi:hypothetical protein